MTNTSRVKTQKAAPAKAKFGQDSMEFKHLLDLFKKGEIKPTEKPASVQARFPQLCDKFTPAQFRAQCSKARTLSGVQGESSHGALLNCQCHILTGLPPATQEEPNATEPPAVEPTMADIAVSGSCAVSLQSLQSPLPLPHRSVSQLMTQRMQIWLGSQRG